MYETQSPQARQHRYPTSYTIKIRKRERRAHREEPPRPRAVRGHDPSPPGARWSHQIQGAI